MTTNGTVTLDPDQVIKLAEEIEGVAKKLRNMGLANYTFNKQQVIEVHAFNIDSIKWKIKGGADATPTDPFAWAFTSNRDNTPIEELKPLIEFLKQNGKHKQNGYEITINKDGKFLNRKKL